MMKFHDVTRENIEENNPNFPQIPDHLYKLIIRGSESGKTNSLFNKSATRYL